MTARATLLGMLLALTMSAVSAGAARAEESEAKKVVQKAREKADKALETAEEKTEQAIEKVKDAKDKVVRATAETKQAAEQAADQVADKAEKAAEKVSELTAEAEAAAEKAKTEAEVAAEEAGNTIRVMRARTHELVREAVGPTGDNARRNAVRRSAWRELARNVDHPDQVPPNVREELRRHAQRVARLRRIRTLASQRNDAALAARADVLIAREDARHKRKLETLWAVRDKQRPSAAAQAPEDDPDPPEETAEEEEEQP